MRAALRTVRMWKTTVTRLANGLIPHFFHGNLSGQVNVNGMDTRETEIAALSDAVGTVFRILERSFQYGYGQRDRVWA